MFSSLGYIDCTSSENGYWCDGCATSPGQPCRVKPSADDETQSGDLCGTCSGNACLHSPNYDSSNDQDLSTCDIGKIRFEHSSKLINKIMILIVHHIISSLSNFQALVKMVTSS